MKIIYQNQDRHAPPSEKLLSATPTIGKSILMAAVALIFGVALLINEVRWIIEGREFGTNQWVFTVVTLVLLAGGTFLAWRVPRAITLERQGELVEGQIIGSWTEVDDENTSHHYLAFSVGDYTFKQQVNRKRVQAHQPGDTVSVLRLPNKPEVARLDI